MNSDRDILAEQAVEVESLGELSPEWYLQNLISQTLVRLVEQSDVETLLDEDTVIAAVNDAFIAHGFRVRTDMIRALLYKPKLKPEELAILNSDCNWLARNIKARLGDYNALLNFIKLLSWTTNIKSQHPVEARWPVLKAVTLLTREDQAKLIAILADTGPSLQTDTLIY